jgi:glycerol-3-phosphate O-acyltransferase
MTPARFILGESAGAPAPPALSREELERLSLGIIGELARAYRPPTERRVTPERVHQPAVPTARTALEAFQLKLFLPGSGVEGLPHLERCLEAMARARTILFLADHRGNLDVPSFNSLVRSAGRRYEPILDKLIYIAGRKLNESSDLVNMFAEQYSRLVVVPRREFPPEIANPAPEERAQREEFEKEARRINRAAFRAMEKLKRAGHIFVLFPTGGRIKPGEHNQPVPETTSYLRTFDTAFLISMEGNTLPPLERMEDERPIQAKVLYRVGPALDTESFLDELKAAFNSADRAPASTGTEAPDFDTFAVQRIMTMLANLREQGRYEG